MASVIPTSRQADVAQPRIARWIVWTLLIAGAIANELGIAGGSWDGAYHDRYIVDTFFSPPHILLYSGMAGTMLVGLSALGAVMYEGHTGREWVRLLVRRPLLLLPVLANLGFLATGPFDELWHRTFGRDQLTAWTVPHAILLLNLAGTAVAVAGLALWLRTPVPIGGLAPAAGQADGRAAGIMLFVGLSMVVTHMWGFLFDWEWGTSIRNPILALGWLYPPIAALDAAICLALAHQLLRSAGAERWWLPLLLVLVAQAWRVVISPVLLWAGYQSVDRFTITLTLAGLSYGLIGRIGIGWRPWARHALFGASYVGIAMLALAGGALPALTFRDILLSAPLVPLAAIAGGALGDRLASWLGRAAGEPL